MKEETPAGARVPLSARLLAFLLLVEDAKLSPACGCPRFALRACSAAASLHRWFILSDISAQMSLPQGRIAPQAKESCPLVII